MRLLRVGGVVVVLVVAVACKKKPAIAELTKAEGPVERQEGHGPFGGAPLGTKFYLGDAARTGDGKAELALAAAAVIKMDPSSIVRFGGTEQAAKIGVELGAIQLQGTGQIGLDIGDIKLGDKGAVLISAKGPGASTIELLMGNAQISSAEGMIDLKIGEKMDISLGQGKVGVVDAGVDAASPIDAAPDANDGGVPANEGMYTITGKKAELLKAGETKWQPLPAGTGKLADIKGGKIRLGAGTTGTAISSGLTLSMAGGSRTQIGDDLHLGLELGVATASVPENNEGKVGVPGGTVSLKAPAQSPAEARLDVNAKGETKIAVLKGSAKLDGTNNGGSLDLRTGETASLGKTGAVHQTAKIPDYYDMVVTIGSDANFTIHDPKGATAVRFAFNGKCGNGGTIEMDTDPKFRTARVTAGKDGANIIADANGWYYRLVCNNGATAGGGHFVVRRDAGTRPLPREQGTNTIDADGRMYEIHYQSVLPKVRIKAPGAGSNFKLHLATGGSEEVFESATNAFTVDGKKLKEATYTYWVERDGTKQEKVSTLVIAFDQTAPQVYIELPVNGKPFGSEVLVKGAVLPGWTAKVDVFDIPIDKNTRRFSATVQPPQGALALGIRLSHPQRGVHYYLRRGK